MFSELVEVTFTIYNPGCRVFTHDNPDSFGIDYSIEDHSMLVVPEPYHSDGWTYAYEPDAVYFDDILIPKAQGLFSRSTHILATWAVGIDFKSVMPGLVTAGDGMTPFEHETWNIGERNIYAPFVDALFDLLDPYLEKLPCKRYVNDKEPEKEFHTVRILTAWSHRCFQCGHPLDPPEWDCEWDLLGEIKRSDIHSILAATA